MIIAIDYLGCGRFRSESGVVTIKIVHYYAYHLSRNHCRQSKVAPEKKNIPGCKFRSTLPRHFPFHAEMYYKSFLNRSPFKDARSNSGSMILLTSLMKREPWNFGCNTSHEYYNWNYYLYLGNVRIKNNKLDELMSLI